MIAVINATFQIREKWRTRVLIRRRQWHPLHRSRTRLSDFTLTFHFYALEKEMATHSGVLAWRIPGTEKPAGLPSMGSHRVGHDWSDLAAAANAGDAGDVGLIPDSGRSPGGGNGNPLQYSCLENFMDREPGRLQSMGSQVVGHG